MSADVKQRDSLLRMKEKLEAAGMMPDILVNNAGIAHYGMLADITEQEWDEVSSVDLQGAVSLHTAIYGSYGLLTLGADY